MNSTEPLPARVFKVVLFGEIGSGKSSVINLLTGKPVAQVSPCADACTMLPRWYPISLGEKKFRLWDTMGFNQPQETDVNRLAPYEQAHALLRTFQDGVDLLLLCTRKDAINASFRRIYWLVNNFFFDGRARIVLVMTHFDGTAEEGWWERNQQTIITRYGIQTLGHVCITAAQAECPPLVLHRAKSKQALEALLRTYCSPDIPLSLPHNFMSNETAASRNLATNYRLSDSEVEALMQKFATPPRLHRVVLFGEAGVGKSSVINLVSGEPVANTSPDIKGCTLASQCHKVSVSVHQFQIWDTVGLNEPNIGPTAYAQAVQKGARLIRDLHQEGGVDLLLFCIQGGRISQTTQSNYRLFQEFTCEGKVLEGWWERNGKGFGEYKINVVAHACITSLPADDPEHQKNHGDKLAQSQSKLSVQALLEESIFRAGTQFTREQGSWVMSVLKKLVELVKQGPIPKKEKKTVKDLIKRCGLSQDQAEELISVHNAELQHESLSWDGVKSPAVTYYYVPVFPCTPRPDNSTKFLHGPTSVLKPIND
ncbi:hypothetical protein BS17DRAFT_767794 [Gyrodon lividus]|nr:hypothetical protein BS17DRAFT_767794 [Gyrodon lividus]